jgi:hypothetical protein
MEVSNTGKESEREGQVNVLLSSRDELLGLMRKLK